jgi:hypothetical protein
MDSYVIGCWIINCLKDDGKSFSYGGKPLIQTYKI